MKTSFTSAAGPPNKEAYSKQAYGYEDGLLEYADNIEYDVIGDLARKIVDKLYEDGYFTFYMAQSPSDPMTDYIEIECRINVVEPWL